MGPVNTTGITQTGPCQHLLKLGTDFQMVPCTYGSSSQKCHKEQSTLQTSPQLTLEEENMQKLLCWFLSVSVLAPEESQGNACFQASIAPGPLREIPSLTLCILPPWAMK